MRFSIKHFQFLRHFSFFHYQKRFRNQVDGNTILITEDGTSFCVVAVCVRNEDRMDGCGIDVGFFHSASNLERAEPGVKEQISFGAMNDCGVATAAAAEDRAAELGGLNRGIGHDVITGGVLAEVKMTDSCFATEI